MHLHFERNANSKCDCTILSLSWMGKVPDDIPEDDGWKLNRTNYYQDGWLATGNVRGIVGVTFTTSHSRKNVEYPLRTNYNLRGHRSDVILVKWNEPYQKLASCDSSGIIFVWIKYEGRWSIELINDRNTPVTHFSWSHDGRMALICYQDGFVLVGSVAGQRYWSSMLNLESTITCGIWTPDDQQVYFGTTQGQVIVMDVHGAMVSQVQLYSDIGITSMSWSCEKFKMEEGEESEPGVSNVGKRSFVLAVSFQNGFIYLLKSFDDVSPAHINTGFDGALGMVMEWSNSRELLAVAGSLQKSSTNSSDSNEALYDNSLQFYTESGSLIYVARIPFSIAAVSALTWGHNDKRLFIATGSQLHIAWVSRRVATLQLLCRLQIQDCIRSESVLPMLPLPNRIKTLIGNLFSQTIRCCVPDLKNLRDFVSRPPMCSTRLHCTMIRHDEEVNISSGTCYTLYLEYLGGLVPLLKGKRTSKIRPEFVIFDPQVNACTIFPDKTSGSKSSSTSGHSSNSTTTNVFTDSSESDYDSEQRRNSPRRLRRRRVRNTRTTASNAERSNTNALGSNDPEGLDELVYLDTLLEDVKLVEVTSNIWGTKFKIHGLAKTVPANLGQITYKTSLLHLQPRQMTLVITELRDDCPFGPDPNFNPNIFSEDEDDSETHISSNNRRLSPSSITKNNNYFTTATTSEGGMTNASRRLQENVLAIAPMSPRPNRLLTRHKNSVKSNQLTNLGRSPLARAESYEDEANSIQDLHYESTNLAAASSSATSVLHNDNHGTISTRLKATASSYHARISNGGACSQSRQAISPLFNDGSVPTLQSPKNAVAPTDIIFERPAVTAAGHTTLTSYSSHTNYTNDMSQLKSSFLQGNLRNTSGPVNPVPLNLNLNTERLDDVYTSITMPATALRKDILFIDEEVPSPVSQQDVPLSAITTSLVPAEASTKISASGAIPIAPECTDSMTRSCSVGFLDSTAITPSAEALVALRRETPNKRLVLIDKRKVRKKRLVNEDSVKTALQPTRKSKSFDSSEISSFALKSTRKLDGAKENARCTQNLVSEENSENTAEIIQNPYTDSEANAIMQTSPSTSKKYEGKVKRKEFITSFTDSPLFSRKYRFRKDHASPVMTRKSDNSGFNIIKQLSEARWRKKSAKSSTQLHEADSKADNTIEAISGETKASVSLHTQALTTLESIINRIRDQDEGRLTPPSTPKRFPRSSPASPASIKKSKRQQSNSPIKNIWNSPLLNRRQRKKLSITESSDDEGSGTNGGSGLEDNLHNTTTSNTSTKQFRDLETFQKAQLRQKVANIRLKRGRIEPNGSSNCNGTPAVRREFVMHNKTPMWNEMSQVYQLDFGGRVTQESAKNFQIEFRGKQVMQFGRIDGNAYTLDFQYPFSALQAFAVALANVTQRLK